MSEQMAYFIYKIGRILFHLRLAKSCFWRRDDDNHFSAGWEWR